MSNDKREQAAILRKLAANYHTDGAPDYFDEERIALEAGAQALDAGRSSLQMPLWTARLAEIEWAGLRTMSGVTRKCCPVCKGTHPDDRIELYGMGTATEEGHIRQCWLHAALINEDAPALAEALDAGGWQHERKEDRAGLIGQPIPDVAGTEPRLSVGEAREALNTQLRCMADEIRAWGTVVDAKVDPAIDALIVASAPAERDRLDWQPITAPDRGLFLVTNNINARNAHGYMSHVWLTDAIHVGQASNGTDPFWCYSQDDWSMNKVVGLRYYVNVTPPLAAQMGRRDNQAAPSASDSVKEPPHLPPGDHP